MPSLRQETTSQTTMPSYASLLRARVIGFTECSLVVTNSHGENSLKFKILVSNDRTGKDDSWSEEKAETVLGVSEASKYVLSGPYCWVDVQIKDSEEGVHGTGNCWLNACGL